MSLENDITAIKDMMEAGIFKAAGPEDLANREAERFKNLPANIRKLVQMASQTLVVEQEYVADMEDFTGNYGSMNDYSTGIDKASFNIKIYRMNIPDWVQEKLDKYDLRSTADDRIWQDMASQLESFADELQAEYKFIEKWYVEGRSGGWLVLELEPISGSSEVGELLVQCDTPESAEAEARSWYPQDFAYAYKQIKDYQGSLKLRSKQMHEIERKIESGRQDVEKMFAEQEYWDSFFEDYQDEIASQDAEEKSEG